MNTEVDPLHIRIHARDAATDVPLAELVVQLQSRVGRDFEVLAQARTGSDGIAVLDLDPAFWRQELMVCAAEHDGPAVPITRAMLNGSEDAVIKVTGTDHVDRELLGMLAEHLIATRRVRVDDVASDLASPEQDSIVRFLPAGARARLLADIDRALSQDNTESMGDAFILDPQALRDGGVQLVPVRDLPHQFDVTDELNFDPDLFIKPGLGWEKFPWALPDDQSYRDYLRSVFILFAHQQKLV